MRNNTILFTLLFIGSLTSSAQNELPSKDGKVLFEAIDSSIKAPANDLYLRSKTWLTDAFHSAKEVIQLDDKEAGTIMGKGNFDFTQTLATYTCYFTFKINVKDNKYRIQLYDIYTEVGTMRITQTADRLNEKRGSDKMKNNIKNGCEKIIFLYRSAMDKKSTNEF